MLNFAEQPFDSYFSGNTVQICPVGALTATQYRFRARPWDLATAETSCTTCAVQCRGALQSSSNRLVRLLGVDSEPVNHGWLCDKGRYGIEWVHSEHRVLEPHGARVRRARRGVVARSPRRRRPAEIKRVLDLHGPGADRGARRRARHQRGRLRVGAPREGRHRHRQRRRAARRRLARRGRARRRPRRDRRLRSRGRDRAARTRPQGGAPGAVPPHQARRGGAGGPARRPRAGRARVVAVRERGRPPAARVRRSARPSSSHRDAGARRAHRDPSSSSLGRAVAGRVAERDAAVAATLAERRPTSASSPRCGAATCTARSAPASRPASCRAASTLDAGREWFTEHWGTVPSARGLDATGILRAAADGKVQVLVLLGSDPLCRLPRLPASRSAALDGAGFVDRGRRVRLRLDATRRRVPPVHAVGREDRARSRTSRAASSASAARSRPKAPRWTTGASRSELAYRLGTDFDLATVDEVTDEIARFAPAHLGCDGGAAAPRARRRRAAARVSTSTRSCSATRDLTILAEDGQGTSWDPIKVEGEVPRTSTSWPRSSDRRAKRAAEAGPRTHRQPSRTPPDRKDRSCPLHVWDRNVRGTDRAGARRVRSAPRGRPQALRRWAGRRRDAGVRAARAGSGVARQPPRPRRARRRERRRGARSPRPAARSSIPIVADPRCRSASP